MTTPACPACHQPTAYGDDGEPMRCVTYAKGSRRYPMTSVDRKVAQVLCDRRAARLQAAAEG